MLPLLAGAATTSSSARSVATLLNWLTMSVPTKCRPAPPRSKQLSAIIAIRTKRESRVGHEYNLPAKSSPVIGDCSSKSYFENSRGEHKAACLPGGLQVMQVLGLGTEIEQGPPKTKLSIQRALEPVDGAEKVALSERHAAMT
jgi:hypothetical protein